MARTLFITGTDTGVGKTILTILLARFLREQKINAAALKPVCSGGRDDAREIQMAINAILPLDEINPWHFRAPIAPTLAARREKKSVKLAQALAHIRSLQKNFDWILVEGAGGLLSPLGENFDSRDLILKLRAAPIVAAQNQLGAVNQILLTLEALPKPFRQKTKIVLMSPPKPDAATNSNIQLLAEFFPAKRIFTLPFFGRKFELNGALKNSRARQTLRALAAI